MVRIGNETLSIDTCTVIAAGSGKTAFLLNKEYVLLVYTNADAYEKDICRYRWLHMHQEHQRVALPCVDHDAMEWSRTEVDEHLGVSGEECRFLLFPYVGLDMILVVPPRQSRGDEEAHRVDQLLQGLVTTIQGLHDHDIFHFDIKPDNVLVVENNAVQMIDVGSLTVFTSSHSLQPPFFYVPYPRALVDLYRYWTQTMHMGTPMYTAPERVNPYSIYSLILHHHDSLDSEQFRHSACAMDYWSLGITLFQIMYYEDFMEWSALHNEKNISSSLHLYESVIDLVHHPDFGKRPSFSTSEKWIERIRGLLRMNPLERYITRFAAYHDPHPRSGGAGGQCLRGTEEP